MAPKFFSWHDIERILVSVSREAPEDTTEYLSWVRSHLVFALSFFSVHQKSIRNLGIDPRSSIGETEYHMLGEVINAYTRVIDLFPQRELERALEIVEEFLPLKAGGKLNG